MRLDYKLLWIEDEPDWMDTFKDEFRDYLLNLGFKLDLQKLTRAPSHQELQNFNLNSYHLILMDYNLGSGKDGSQIIREIRQLGVVTEVVFYTADEPHYKQIQALPLEGVYWASRDEFDLRIKEIIQHTIKRVMDLPAMRGLAITEVADIDHMMNDVIKNYHGALEDLEQAKFKKKLFERIKRSTGDSFNKVTKKEQEYLEELEAILKSGFIDTNKRWRTVSDIVKLCSLDNNCVKTLEEFIEVLKQRNDLAHGYTKESEDGEDQIIGNNKNYTLADALNIRKNLLTHRDNFEIILEKLIQER